MASGGEGAGRGGGRVARNTAIFSLATGVSRVVGLAREIVAASFFGTGGPASAFTIAFQIPNLVSNLFANAALSAAFVPVFTDLLQQGSATRGVPARLDAVLDHADRPRRPDRVLRARRRRDHAAVHGPHVQRPARRPHRRALAGAVPGGAADRADRPARRGAAVLRTLHDPGDLPGGVEPRDHRAARRPAPALPRRLSKTAISCTRTRSRSWPRRSCSC